MGVGPAIWQGRSIDRNDRRERAVRATGRPFCMRGDAVVSSTSEKGAWGWSQKRLTMIAT